MFMFNNRPRSFNSTYYVESKVFEFRDKVLDWDVDSILYTEENLDCVPRLATYSDSWSYYSSLQPLIIAEARATLKEGLEFYQQGKTNGSRLKVSDIRGRSNGPQTLEMVGSIRRFDPKLEMVLLVSTKQMFFGQLSIRDQNIKDGNIVIKCSDNREVNVDYVFEVYQLCSLVTLNRAYEVCGKIPHVPFARNLFATSFIHNNKLSPIKQLDGDFNLAQKEAISAFLSLETGLQLLQGPPGTGKTTTITFLLENLIANGESILVCAPSNKAVQVIAKRFLKKNLTIPIIFAGREEKLDAELESIFLDTWKFNILKELKALELKLSEKISLLELQVESVKTLQFDLNLIHDSISSIYADLKSVLSKIILYKVNVQPRGGLLDIVEKYKSFKRNQIQDFDLKIELQNLKGINQHLIGLKDCIANIADIDAHLLSNSKVVFCTLSFAGQQRMSNINITSLIIDEAAQACEADTIIPLQHKPRKCLLVGDTNQLPAVVKSELAKANNYDWSMMHRLQVEAGFPYKMLNIQYRMDPRIRSWPSKQFYEDKLEDSPDIAERDALSLPSQIYPCAFIDVKGKETTSYSSKKNDEEVVLIIKLLKYLQSEGFSLNKDVGIITFYSGQVERINQGLRDAKLADISAQTVDGFQGEEKEIIIISFVRSNKANNVGFLSDFRRLNVAITRARRALIMIGDSETLAMDETLGSMLKHILQNKNLHRADYIEREILSKSRQSLELKSKPLSSHAFQKMDWSSFKKEPSFLPSTESQQSWRQGKLLVKETEDEKTRLPSLGQNHSTAASQATKAQSTLGSNQALQKEEWPTLPNKPPTLQSGPQQLWKSFQQGRKEKEKNGPLLELRSSAVSSQASETKPIPKSNQLLQQKEEWPKLKNKQ